MEQQTVIKQTFFRRLHAYCRYACVGLLAVLYTSYTHAIFGLGGAVYVGDRPNASIDVGYAMARSVVLDDAGNPYIVTFNEKGEEISLLLSGQAARDAIVASAAAYRQERQQLTDFKAQTPVLAQQAQLLSRIEYEQTTFTTASGEAVTPPSLSERVKSVLVRGPITRLPDANNLVLMRFGFNQAEDAGVGADARSLIVDEQGNVLQISPHTIGYRSGFFGSDTEPETGFRRITSEDKVYGPLARSVVKPGGAPGGGVVDDKGRFGFSTFFGVCPIGGYWYDYSLFTPVYYANRAPISAPAIPFYLKSLSSHYCYADLVPLALVPAVQSIIAARTRPFFQRRILLDVLFFTGDIKIQNIVGEDVPIGDTTYTSFDEDAEKRTQDFYDFNGDGASDTVVRGNVVPGTDAQGQPIERFIADSEGDKQGIFFDGSQDDDEFPDLIRLIDEERRITEPMGLLKSISSDDFRNTDLYLFRESTGQLLMERRGFKDTEDRRNGVRYDEASNGFGYRLMFRGPDDSRLNIGGPNTRVGEGDSARLATYEEWATQSQLTEPFRERRGDNVRTGEFIKLVAINRATGYTGTIRVQLGQLRGNSPGVVAPTLTLQPPNLRIWAQRNYAIDKGLTKGEEKTYTIGSEGASLTSDKTITIYTEWLDEAGLPLPAGLGADSGEQYGLTGRLAKVVSAGSLAGVGNVGGNDLSEFPIGPGRKTQVVKVGDNLSSAEHFYVHVIGKPKDQECIAGSTCPAFDLPNNEPNLEGRPQLLTPFLVPLPNEDQYWVDYRNYRALLQQETNAETPLRPLPAYAWQYRPEYQFSQFEFNVNKLNLTSKSDNSTVNILNKTNQIIPSGDDFIEILYDFLGKDIERLAPVDGEQELILSLGEYEQSVTVDSDRNIHFDQLSYLQDLDSEDFLSIRLYANNDAANFLWAYQFADFSLFPQETIEISADDAQAYIVALVGHQDGSQVTWEILDGNGSLSKSLTETEDNAAVTTLQTSTTPGDTYTVQGVLKSIPSDAGEKALNITLETKQLEVVAGEPADIQLDLSKPAYQADSTDTITLTATIRDQFGNLVEDDTSVSWLVRDSDEGFTSTDNLTINGVATAVVQAPGDPGAQIISIRSGTVEQTTSIAVAPIAGTLVSNQADLNLNSSDTAQITATVNASDGTPVFWLTSNGSISGDSTVTGGQATAMLESSGGNTGSVVVTATIGDRLLSWQGAFSDSAQLTATLTHPVIVDDASQDGTGQVTWPDGTVRTIGFKASTPVQVQGPANSQLTVSLPGQTIVEAFTFNALTGGDVVGELADHVLAFTGAALDTSIQHLGQASLNFDGTGNGNIAQHSDFNFSTAMNLAMWVRPASLQSAKLLKKGSAWSLEQLDDGRVKAKLSTNTGTYSVTSAAVLTPNEWSLVSLQYDGSRLRVAVNANVNYTEATGSIDQVADEIIVASGYIGHIDDLSFSDQLGASAIVSLDGIDAAGQITTDASGAATFSVSNHGSVMEYTDGNVSTLVPIDIRINGTTTSHRGFSLISKAYAADDQATTYLQVVEKGWWFYTYDSVTSFFGADPESGAGIAASVAGGVLVVGDIGAIIKNTWRAAGGSDTDVAKLETTFAVLGVASTAGSPLVDTPIAVVRAIAGRVGSSPFLDVLMTRATKVNTGDDVFSAAESALLKRIGSGDDLLVQGFNEVIKSPELYEAAIKAADELGDEFFDVFLDIVTNPNLGFVTTENVVKVLGDVDVNVLRNIRASPVPMLDALTGLAQAGSKVSPELLVKVLGNDNLYTAGYKQGELLRDMGQLADVKGFDLLADALSTGNKNGLKDFPNGLGFRFELEAAAALSQMGVEIVELTRVVAARVVDGVDLAKTDIDIIINLGAETFVQVKRSAEALKSLPKVKEWVAKAIGELGTQDYSRIKYVLPDDVVIPPKIAEFLSRDGKVIDVIRIKHL